MCHTLVCYCYCYCVAVEDPGLERSTCDHDWHNLMWANNSIKVWCKYNMNSTQIQQKYQYDSFSDQWHVWVPKLGEIESGRRSVGKVIFSFHNFFGFISIWQLVGLVLVNINWCLICSICSTLDPYAWRAIASDAWIGIIRANQFNRNYDNERIKCLVR